DRSRRGEGLGPAAAGLSPLLRRASADRLDPDALQDAADVGLRQRRVLVENPEERIELLVDVPAPRLVVRPLVPLLVQPVEAVGEHGQVLRGRPDLDLAVRLLRLLLSFGGADACCPAWRRRPGR